MSVCAFVYMCLCAYVCACENTCMWECVCLCEHVYLCICVWESKSVCGYVFVKEYVYVVLVYKKVCACVTVCLWECACACKKVRVCVGMCLWEHVCMCAKKVRIGVCERESDCVSVCMFVCLCILCFSGYGRRMPVLATNTPSVSDRNSHTKINSFKFNLFHLKHFALCYAGFCLCTMWNNAFTNSVKISGHSMWDIQHRNGWFFPTIQTGVYVPFEPPPILI